MLKIGLTGGIGSGKTTASKIFKQLGIDVIDTDEISREITMAGGRAVRDIMAAFGNAAVETDGSMNRRYIRDLVFEDFEEKKRLESILHPIIQEEAIRRIEACGSTYCVVAVPLFFESDFWPSLVDRVLTIDAPEELQIKRVKERNALPTDQIRAILRSQYPRELRISKSDDVVVNTGSEEELRKAIEALHRKYVELAAKDHNTF